MNGFSLEAPKLCAIFQPIPSTPSELKDGDPGIDPKECVELANKLEGSQGRVGRNPHFPKCLSMSLRRHIRASKLLTSGPGRKEPR